MEHFPCSSNSKISRNSHPAQPSDYTPISHRFCFIAVLRQAHCQNLHSSTQRLPPLDLSLTDQFALRLIKVVKLDFLKTDHLFVVTGY